MPLVEDLVNLRDDEKRHAVIKRAHPLYSEFIDSWEVLTDAFDGVGGFKDGSYLYEFPREDASKYQARAAQARYHNYVESLVELFTRYLTRDVQRTTESEDLESWWQDVDGRGTNMDDMIRDVIMQGLATGHVGALVDKPVVEPGETRADDATQPFISLYPPLAIQDWIWDPRDGIHAIKLREGVTPDTFDPDASTEKDFRYLIWDAAHWARFDQEGDWIPDEFGENALGRVPFVVFRPKRMKRYPFLGKALVNPQVVLALFNRASEEDEVLRTQAFSQLIVSLSQDADAEMIRKAQDLISEGGGTQKALVVPGTARYETPDMATAEAIRENQAFLVREVYRMAHIPYRSDSREVESAEAIRLQHQELNEMLRGIANDLTQFEKTVARLYFGWQEPTEEQADAAFEAANVTVQYPDEFFTRELSEELESWAAAVAFNLGPTAEKAIKRRVVATVLSESSQDVKDQIDEEIEQGVGQSGGSPAEQLRQAAAERMNQFVEEEPAA